MKKIETALKDCYIIEPDVFGDKRGYFMRVYRENELKAIGIDCHFVEGNESLTAEKHTIRGLHFLEGEYSQAKLVRCVTGAVDDVVVDLRKSSPTYKKYIKVELSSDNKRELFVPRGFAHGFITLTDDVRFVYQVDNAYDEEHDASILWCDPEIGIDWGLNGLKPILSEKDKNAPMLKESKANFR